MYVCVCVCVCACALVALFCFTTNRGVTFFNAGTRIQVLSSVRNNTVSCDSFWTFTSQKPPRDNVWMAFPDTVDSNPSLRALLPTFEEAVDRVAVPTSTATTSTPPTATTAAATTAPLSSSSSTPTGAIVGGTLAALFVLVMLVAVFVVIRCVLSRRKKGGGES